MHTLTLDEIETLFRGPARVEPKPAKHVPYVLRLSPLAPAPLYSAFENHRCCALAVSVDCVCIASWTCPKHGEGCHGSH